MNRALRHTLAQQRTAELHPGADHRRRPANPTRAQPSRSRTGDISTNGGVMRRPLAIFGTGLAIAACVVGWCPGGAAASTHFGGHISFPDTLCGFSGITTFSTEDNFGSLANGGTYDNGRFVQTFVADNGRGVEIDYNAGHGVFSPPVANADGTFTQILTGSGLNVLTKAVNGPVLEHGAGRVQVTFILDAQGNTISTSAVALSGNQPNLSGAPDCSVITPYLAG